MPFFPPWTNEITSTSCRKFSQVWMILRISSMLPSKPGLVFPEQWWYQLLTSVFFIPPYWKVEQPKTSKKWLETAYSLQEMTWNKMKKPTASKKQPMASKKKPWTTYREQESTWNRSSQRAKSDLKRPLKKRF